MNRQRSLAAWRVLLLFAQCAALLPGCAGGEGAAPADAKAEAARELELGESEQAFSASASVTPAPDNSAPFGSVVKFNIISDCTGIRIPPLQGSTRARILTAGHCVSERTTDRAISITNALNGALPAQSNATIPANRTFVHPSYQLGDNGTDESIPSTLYDIAFFELAADPGFSSTAHVITPIAINTSLTGVGYGRTGANCGSNPTGKNRAAVSSAQNFNVDLTTHNIITAVNPTTCPGDSGGPLLLGTAQNARVVGVVSSHVNTRSDYTRLENVFEWINDPVDSTLAAIPSSLVANNSAVYLMNGAIFGNPGVPPLRCAAHVGTTSDIRNPNDPPKAMKLQSCDGPSGTYTGNSSAWRLLTDNVPAGTFRVVNRRTGLCLGIVQSTVPASGANVLATKCLTDAGTARDNQTWAFEPVSGLQAAGTVIGSAYRIRPRSNNGLCLSAQGNNNDPILVASCQANNVLPVHKWYLTR